MADSQPPRSPAHDPNAAINTARPGVHARPPGVRIIASGIAVPEKTLTNSDLEKIMDTSDEWIVQRTGIRNRHIHDPQKGDSVSGLATEALRNALQDAGMVPDDLDLIVVATMTPESPTPSVACRVTTKLGVRNIGAFDLNAACSGFVYALNTVFGLMATGAYRNIALIGADTITQHVEYSTYGRGSAVLFGDAAGAVILQRTDDPMPGLLAHILHSDGPGSKDLYVPTDERTLPEGVEYNPRHVNRVQMHGPAVFRFAVGTFPKLIEETLEHAGLQAADVDYYICHQSNVRILKAAQERFGLEDRQFPINIDRYGNTVAASVPLVFHELRQGGKIQPGQRVMFLGFGAGLTWASSLWQL
ncbi:MAG: ketoacyl-ACP synthase III [Phycisphaerales bacterium]|nr:MAG: ketoacyl-ACP synthase III [Phycisphaerales bacterium]